ncbi:MAG TPA: tetratricopeptide repeat protein [Myxococcota bacterium]|nr:tetratricopeptide repeat protein [Myxococcota bacterium]
MPPHGLSQSRTRLGLVLVALLACAVFLPSLDGDFVYDDLYQIRENDQLRSLANLPRFFTADVWAAVGLPFSSYYRPLMYTTFAVETAIAGPVPWIYRTTNALLHAGVSVLLALLLLRLGHSAPTALAGGALFAVHPMHGEVVAWPSARPELLVTAFSLGAAWVHAASDPVRGPTRARFLATGALVMLALLSKETGILAPVLIGLVTLQRAGGAARERIAAGVRAAVPFLALVLVFIGLRSLVIHTGSAPPLVGDDPLNDPFRTWGDAVLHVAAIAGRYLGVMLVPIEASSFRVPEWENVWWGLAILPLAGLALALAPRSRAASWLAFAFLAVAIQSVGVPSAGYLSQRYAYFPSVGVCAFFALLLARWLLDSADATRRRVSWAGLAAMLVVWTALLLPRSLEWAHEPRLWAAAIERDPDAPAVIANHAYMLLDQGRAEEALALFRHLETVEPKWAAPYGQANALAAMGRLEEAIPLYEEGIARAPMVPYLFQGLGFAYEDLGDYEKARETYERALELFPDSSLGQGVLSVLEAKAGNPAEALARADEALALRPDHLGLRLNRVALLAQVGRVDEAIEEGEALARDPALAPDAHAHLGILFDRYRQDPARARYHYREALRLAPDRADAPRLQRRLAVLERSQQP